ncbi:MAG: ATP-binding protein [Casimicrobiaceae bacterium]
MMTLWPESLRGRAIAVVLVTTLVALVVATTSLAIYDAHAYRQSLTNDLVTQAEILGRVNAPAIAFDDPKSARENLAVMRARPGILSADVYKPDGRLFASYDPSGAAAPPILDASTAGGVRIDGDDIWLVHPVVEKGEPVGTVLLHARYELHDRLASYLAILIAVMFASLCVAVPVSALLQRRITNPMLAISGVAREVMQRRDFSLRVARTDTLEVDVLVDAFNAMLAEVGRQTDALAASNRTLQSEMGVRLHAEEALRVADRNKDQFLATLAHELRNPLAPLYNGVSLLKLPKPAAMEPGRILDMMERQLRQLVRLIDDLLDVSRIATNKLVLRKAAIDVRAAMNVAMETVNPFVRERQHALAVHLPAEPILMEGDATRLSQVFANLLHNAAKFTAPGGRIAVNMAQDEAGLTISVADTGIGIEPAMLTRIFDLFEQADRSLERPQAGLGVGLSLARRIVDLHGGSLEAVSEGPGRGSEFVVRLPQVAAPISVGDLAPKSRSAPPALRHRILIVDDNRDFAESLEIILTSLGHDVRVANDGIDGLDEAQKFVPEIAFLDIGMPRLNGYELAARIRQIRALARTVLVAVTGWGQESDRRRALDAGFDRHLMKPVEPAEIVAMLRELPSR